MIRRLLQDLAGLVVDVFVLIVVAVPVGWLLYHVARLVEGLLAGHGI